MAALTMSEELLEYFTKLPEHDQREVISFVKSYVEDDEYEHKQPQTLEEYNRELEEGSAAVSHGEYIAHEEVMKRYNM